MPDIDLSPDVSHPSPPRRRRTAVAATIALVALLVPAAGAFADGSLPMDDVASDSIHAEAVAWALEHGVSFGCTDTTFCPGDPITREQAASMLMRLSQAGILDAATIDGLDLSELDARFAGPGEPGRTGATGATGASGPTGATGPAGTTGAGGLAGANGLTGLTGLTGSPGVEGPEGPEGPQGPEGPPGADGTSPDLEALTTQIDALTEQIELLRYGATVITATFNLPLSIQFRSQVSDPADCSTSACEYRTFPGHAVTASLFSQGTSFRYTCGDGSEQIAVLVNNGGFPGYAGSCVWSAADGGVPAGYVAITATPTLSEV